MLALAACGDRVETPQASATSEVVTTSSLAESATTLAPGTSSTTELEEETEVTDPTSGCTGELPTNPPAEDGYRRTELCGWPVYINNDLFIDPLAVEVYRELAEDMQTVISVVPEPAVEMLQDTNIWMELDEEGFVGGVYHPSAEWLEQNGYPTKWAKGIQFGNARNFLTWPDQQPAMLLHEFTHALHDQYYGFWYPDVVEAYDQAMAAGLYDSVEHVTGGFQEAYAATNQQEYLAELTEAYFWTNDIYPFDRQDLAAHDPAGLALVEQIWEVE